jgi:hypothetical protein
MLPQKLYRKRGFISSLYQFLSYGELMSSKINVIKYDVENDGILNIVEKLQFSDDSEIYDMAKRILSKFWHIDEEGEYYYRDATDIFDI